jgi:hypothetical protein
MGESIHIGLGLPCSKLCLMIVLMFMIYGECTDELGPTLLEIRVLQEFFTNTYNKPYPIGLLITR